jgi:Flp pilus assembly protein TadD
MDRNEILQQAWARAVNFTESVWEKSLIMQELWMRAARRRELQACKAAVLASGLLLAGCVQNQADNANPQAPVGPTTLNVADAAIAGGDPNMALSVSQSVLANDPNNVDALVHEGDAYYALGRCPPAQAAYQLALDHDAHATAAELGLGRCLLKTDPAAAESALEAAVQDDPGNAAAWNDLGIARDLQGNFAGAVNPYQKALLANPALTAAEVNLGLSLALSGNGPEALQYLGPLATGPEATPKIREDYAAALVATGRPDQAKLVLGVDLPPDEVLSAMNGFSAIIANSQQPPPPPAPPPPTVPAVATTSVTQTVTMPPPATPRPLVPAPAPAVAAPPAPAAVAPPSDPDAAYTGPPPIPVTASSSTPGPAGTPVPEPQAPAPVTPPAAGASTGGDEVQLGALDSQDDAERAWRDISGATPALFSGKSPDIQPATVNGKTYYRLRVGGFANKAAAATFCAEVSAAGNACTVANF